MLLFLIMRSILLALLLTSLAAHARLGETRDQSEARYGLPKAERVVKGEIPLIEGARELTFYHAGFRIRCALLLATDGVEYIVREEYSHLTPGAKVTLIERDAMMEAELGGFVWKEVPPADPAKLVTSPFLKEYTSKVWVRPDGAFFAAAENEMRVRVELPQARKWETQFKLAQVQKERAIAPKF